MRDYPSRVPSVSSTFQEKIPAIKKIRLITDKEKDQISSENQKYRVILQRESERRKMLITHEPNLSANV